MVLISGAPRIGRVLAVRRTVCSLPGVVLLELAVLDPLEAGCVSNLDLLAV
jgi:hypothetical protein